MKPMLVVGADEAVVAVENGAKEGKPFQLVLTDLHMPGKDGFELVEELRRQVGFEARGRNDAVFGRLLERFCAL